MMYKTTIAITLDQDLVTRLRNEGLNISGTINAALIDYLGLKEKPVDQLQVEREETLEKLKVLEDELQAKEAAKIKAMEEDLALEAEAKAKLRAEIEAQSNTPERIARRKELEEWTKQQEQKRAEKANK